MITRYIKGDIRETELKHIIHGVNCQNTMASGVAKGLFEKWPSVKEQYHAYMTPLIEKGRLPSDFLGTCMPPVEVEPGKFVHNLFTQEDYGYDGVTRFVNYNAVVTSIKFAFSVYYDDGPIAMPKIGCGLAGGNWTFMEQLINDAFQDRFEFWVYEMDNARLNKRNDLA